MAEEGTPAHNEDPTRTPRRQVAWSRLEHAHSTSTAQHGHKHTQRLTGLSRRRPPCSAETAHRHDPDGGSASRTLGWADWHAHGVAHGWGRRGGLDWHGDDGRPAARLLHDGRGRPGDGEERSVHPRLVYDAALGYV